MVLELPPGHVISQARLSPVLARSNSVTLPTMGHGQAIVKNALRSDSVAIAHSC